jgi:hypothetical protein
MPLSNIGSWTGRSLDLAHPGESLTLSDLVSRFDAGLGEGDSVVASACCDGRLLRRPFPSRATALKALCASS